MAGRRRAARILRALGWTLVAGMGAVAVLRLWGPVSVPLLIGVQGVTVWLLLPAHLLAAIAAWRRELVLGLACGSLAAAHVVVVAVTVGWNGRQELGADDVPLRLVSANVLYANRDVVELADDVAAEGADVVLLQEVTPRVLRDLRSSSLWSAYPYRSLAPRPLFEGAATFSRLPITRGCSVDVGGSPMLVTDLQTRAGALRVVNVHVVAPLTDADAAIWAGQFPALARLVDDSPDPVVMAGDFNATLDHDPLDALVTGDVRDAFTVAGTGLGATWPTWGNGIPPLMRLDHVLVGGSVEVGSLTEEPSVGSDHARLVAELGISPPG